MLQCSTYTRKKPRLQTRAKPKLSESVITETISLNQSQCKDWTNYFKGVAKGMDSHKLLNTGNRGQMHRIPELGHGMSVVSVEWFLDGWDDYCLGGGLITNHRILCKYSNTSIITNKRQTQKQQIRSCSLKSWRQPFWFIYFFFLFYNTKLEPTCPVHYYNLLKSNTCFPTKSANKKAFPVPKSPTSWNL